MFPLEIKSIDTYHDSKFVVRPFHLIDACALRYVVFSGFIVELTQIT